MSHSTMFIIVALVVGYFLGIKFPQLAARVGLA